jgi:GNAT superfamily N-acetyltransferase
MPIRPANPDDAELVAALLTELDYPTTPGEARARLAKFHSRTDCRALVVTDEREQPIALASAQVYPSLERDAPSGTITAFVVSKSARRGGVGRTLVGAIESYLREQGCVRVTVGSHLRRTDAHAFYEALGYERSGFRFARMLVTVMALLIFTAALGSNAHAAPPLHVDHIILGVSDLDAGIREFESLTGVRAVFGGKHPGRGTQNALVSLGPRMYLEIMAPQPGGRLEGDFAGIATLEHLTPVGFAVFAPDIAAVRAQLARDGVKTTEPQAGARATPAGTTLHWTTFGILEPKLDVAPFFIRWEDPAVHPARTSPGGCTLETLDLTAPSAADAVKLRFAPVIHTHSGAEALAFTLRCGERTIHFPR